MEIDAYADRQSAQVIQVESSKLLVPMMFITFIACLIGATALGISIGARDTANRAERESRLQRLETDELKVALKVQGLKTHEE